MSVKMEVKIENEHGDEELDMRDAVDKFKGIYRKFRDRGMLKELRLLGFRIGVRFTL